MNLKTIALCAALVTTPTWSQMKYSLYQDSKGTPQGRSYVAGLSRGVTWANVAMEAETGKSLFCEPNSLVMDLDKTMAFIDAYAATLSKEEIEKTPIEMMLIKSLRALFPCPTSQAPR